MARFKDLADVKTGNLFKVPPRKLQIEPGFNIRDLDPAHVRNIADAIKAGVVMPPLEVRLKGEDIFVVDGHHRHAAAIIAIEEGTPLASLDCRQFSGNDADAIIAMLSSGEAKPHSAIERCNGYKRLVNLGLTVEQIAGRTGKSTAHINSLLLLARADTSIQNAVAQGEIAATAAIAIVRAHKEAATPVVTQAIHAAKEKGKGRATGKEVAAATQKLTGKALTKRLSELLEAAVAGQEMENQPPGFKSWEDWRVQVRDALSGKIPS